MPEGPEIRRAADRVARGVVGETAHRVALTLPGLAAYGERLSGSRVLGVETWGKAMVTHFDVGLSVYSHNQLYGRWYVVGAGTEPRTKRQLRFGIYADTHDALLYSASSIEVLATPEVAEHRFIAKLGPDPLREETQPRHVARQLSDPRFRGRQLAASLLDQAFVAGIGNYLRAEILFFSGIHPARRPEDLESATRRRLARWIYELPRRAYETGGVTDDPRRVRKHEREGQTRRQYRHAVFNRAGLPCRRCGAKIQRLELGGRRIYLCGHCQT